MRVLVTGGAGYIGSVTVEQLVERGDEVAVFDDLSTGHPEAVVPGAALVRGDLTDPDAVRSALGAGFDAVVHFAAKALVGESFREPDTYRRVNVDGSRNLLAAMREAGVTRIVFSSTAAVYGEPDAVPIGEDAAARPLNPYGETKLAGDEMLAEEARSSGLAATSLRYFNVAGASARCGEDHDPETHLVPLVLEAAAGARGMVEIYGTDYPTDDGTAVRDFVHVSDLARAHLLALDAPTDDGHRVYNLGSGSGHSVREVVSAAEAELGAKIKTVESERRPGDPAVLVASSQRIERELGWRPELGLSEMIASAWAFMRSHPSGY